MARVVSGSRRATMDPVKYGQPLGGALAYLGLARCMPLTHGAQGCAAFAKALLTRHFREPIPLQTSALTELTAILGSTESLHAAIATIGERHHPDVIGVLTTGITEISGEDLAGALSAYPAEPGGGDGPLVIAASTPDFEGGLSDGWSAALTAIVTAAGEPAGSDRDATLVAVPVGVSLSAADLDELTELVSGFGLSPLVVPNLSGSLDGHLAADWSPLTTGGTTVDEVRRLSRAGTVLAVGATAATAGATLAARSGADLVGYHHCAGLVTVDALVAELIGRTGRPAPDRLRRDRSRLADGLLDGHFVLGGARVALAGEPESLAGVATVLAEAGAEIVAAVAATPSDVLGRVPCDEVVVGDLVDLEERAAEAGAELVIASSHARDLARRLGVAHLAAGFPVYDRLGAALSGGNGYRGSLNLLFRAANHLLGYRESGHPRGRPATVGGTGPRRAAARDDTATRSGMSW